MNQAQPGSVPADTPETVADEALDSGQLKRVVGGRSTNPRAIIDPTYNPKGIIDPTYSPRGIIDPTYKDN